MLLRPRQETFVERCHAALQERGQTLGVAPTGAGKTVMLSAITGRTIGAQGRALVIQHRDELVEQNRKTYHRLYPRADSGVIDADRKDWHRQVSFAMVQTLARNLPGMRPVDALVVDEAHHAAADSYRKIIDRARDLNPALKLLGVTATPNRGDKKGLRSVFDNVADQIPLGELIAGGFLVRPRTFVIDVGVQSELREVRKTLQDFDMTAVEKIMDKEVVTDAVVKHWRERAGDRQTVVFCSTVEHASHVRDAFAGAGVAASVVHGDMAEGDRKRTLAAFDRGEIRVVVNVAVLTEGWDCQPVSCVVLLRPSSYKSTMIQMIGRGLRPVDPQRYPGVIKSDCIVLDFGTSTLLHGSLEQDVQLDDKPKGEAPKVPCGECGALIPISAKECPICGHAMPGPELPDGEGDEKGALGDFAMTEVDLFNASPFKWEDLWGDQSALVASGFEAWAVAIFYQGQWYGICGSRQEGIKVTSVGDRFVCIAACDDWMRNNADTEAAGKSRRWLHLPATDSQLNALGMDRMTALGLTRYAAACRLTWKFNERGIRPCLQGAVANYQQRAAA